MQFSILWLLNSQCYELHNNHVEAFLESIRNSQYTFNLVCSVKCQNLSLINICDVSVLLTLPMLRLLSSKAQWCKDFRKTTKPCHVGIHSIALVEYSQMSTYMPWIQLIFLGFLHHFVLTKLATSSIRVKSLEMDYFSVMPYCPSELVINPFLHESFYWNWRLVLDTFIKNNLWKITKG